MSDPDIFGKDTIFVWWWADAPTFYKSLSPHGGDEDWLAFVPEAFGELPPVWLESGTPFGRCETSKHEVKGGFVYIGSHS